MFLLITMSYTIKTRRFISMDPRLLSLPNLVASPFTLLGLVAERSLPWL
jgi:hypothetical protein